MQPTKKEWREVEVRGETVCDLCGRETRHAHTSSYSVADVTIHVRKGTNYPDSGCGTEYSPDLCLECFVEKVYPLLQQLMPDIGWKDWDW